MRYYAIQTWVGSHENQPEYNGQQVGARNAPSVEVPTFDRNGKPNFEGFSDESLEARKPKKKSSISIQDRILPQAARVNKLTNQMRELVNEYKAGNISIDEYSMLLSVISAKRNRAEQLLEKAKSVRAPFETLEDNVESDENKPDCLGKTHVNSDKNDKTSKGTAIEGNRFKDVKKPSNSFSLSKVADFINNHQFTYFVVCSTIALTAAKLIF